MKNMISTFSISSSNFSCKFFDCLKISSNSEIDLSNDKLLFSRDSFLFISNTW